MPTPGPATSPSRRPSSRGYGPATPLAVAGALLLLGSSALAAPQQPAAPDLRYDRDVRPILADRCFRCHGPDGGSREAGLRLDEREHATAADGPGRAAIVPGDLERSELWRRVTTDDEDDAMPPASSGKARLDAEQRAILRRWIEAGAPYEPHWSFVPPQRPDVPATAAPARVRTPVDAFVVAALERRGLQPSPPADPATQLRRLFLTLTGLPPTPEELDAFLADPSDAAYDRTVDRLLTEEPYRSRYAERMASPWLDGARYADTSGIHMDAGRQIWPYRDWVLRAFRDNMPFDRFVVEQIAGDLLPEATLDQKVASGFQRCHVTTDEGGAIDEEYLVEYAADRTATTGSVLLGVTLHCARCHEHKFDPISHEDYYKLFAFFNSIEEPGLYSQSRDASRALEPFVAVPSPEQARALQELQTELAAVQRDLEVPSANEAAEEVAFVADVRRRAGVQWLPGEVVDAASVGGAELTVQSDGSVLVSGPNPEQDVHTIRLRTDGAALRLLCLEALPDPSMVEGRVGRAENGNAVLQSIEVEAISVADPAQRRRVPLVWAWADVEQQNGDFGVIGALRSDDGVGWAVDAHSRESGPRTALFLVGEPFGYEGGTEVVVTLDYGSTYARHTFGRVRLQLGTIDEPGLALLPGARGDWFVTGPFPNQEPQAIWDAAHGPELAATFDRAQVFARAGQGEPAGEDGGLGWRHVPEYRDGVVNALPQGSQASYVASEWLVPSARRVALSLGSDDGFRLFLDGVEVAGRRVERGAAPGQDRAEVELSSGAHVLVMKVVNTGGSGAFYVAPEPRAEELSGPLVAALLPDAVRSHLAAEVRDAWRRRFSPSYAAQLQRRQEIEAELAAVEQQIPRTMVMKERAEPRAAFVLLRGEYDKPDEKRPVERGIPPALGGLPEGAPKNRLGLAQWLISEANPLVLRVQANRLWEIVFGSGLVRTTEDLGMQGEWPSHPELIDWLACELRAADFDLQHVLRLLVRSSTFRQQSHARREVLEIDPDNRLLAWYPRRRLSAEQLRDSALFVAGLLVERFGGPSVKPYQPPGLWQEVAMVQSNTRVFERGAGDDLYRRSLYTYWKRACPPPSMLTFDAPTREFCTIRRSATNTPLQALVLWNDEQFVEAARALAEGILGADEDDRSRLATLYRRCTGRSVDDLTSRRLQAVLDRFRARYAAAEPAARALLAVGERAVDPSLPPAELAAWTMLANAVLNLDATICMP